MVEREVAYRMHMASWVCLCMIAGCGFGCLWSAYKVFYYGLQAAGNAELYFWLFVFFWIAGFVFGLGSMATAETFRRMTGKFSASFIFAFAIVAIQVALTLSVFLG